MSRSYLAAFALVALGLGIWAGSSHGAAATGHDWTRFNYSPWRTGAPTFATGITAANVGQLKRQQVQLPGTADSSPIYLHAVQVGGATHDVFFVTTTYGKTLAVNAASGTILWTFTPPGYSTWVGSPQITTATPVADPGRRDERHVPLVRLRVADVPAGRRDHVPAVVVERRGDLLARREFRDRGAP